MANCFTCNHGTLYPDGVVRCSEKTGDPLGKCEAYEKGNIRIMTTEDILKARSKEAQPRKRE